MATLPVIAALLVVVVYLTASQATPTLQRDPAAGPRPLDPTQILDLPDPGTGIEELPWNVFARFANKVCSGIIIHKDWVLLLDSCATDAGINTGSTITVHAGGETPERVQQVVEDRVHPIASDADPLEGVVVLHLEKPLVFGYNKVMPARLPSVHETYSYSETKGVAAGFSLKEAVEIRLEAFFAVVLDVECPNRGLLCAKSDSDPNWPTENSHTRGTDFIDVTDYYDQDLDEDLICVVGARKAAVENSLLVEYYPTYKMSNWIAENLGLRVVPPKVSSPCGYLIDQHGQ